jgi:hypothetical protein
VDDGVLGCFNSVADTEFVEDAGEVDFDGLDAQVELVGNFFVAKTFGNEAQNLPFPQRQGLDWRDGGCF